MPLKSEHETDSFSVAFRIAVAAVLNAEPRASALRGKQEFQLDQPVQRQGPHRLDAEDQGLSSWATTSATRSASRTAS